MRYEFTDFGKKVKVTLINRNQSQEWLIAQVRDKTGLYFDSSYLNKIMTGKNENEKIISAIKKVLSID